MNVNLNAAGILGALYGFGFTFGFMIVTGIYEDLPLSQVFYLLVLSAVLGNLAAGILIKTPKDGPPADSDPIAKSRREPK